MTKPLVWVEHVLASEVDGYANFRVFLAEPSNLPVTVDFSTLDGSAAAGTDYEFKSGSLTFQPGDSIEKLVQVKLIQDSQAESAEQFQLLLSNPVNASLDSQKTPGIATVVDKLETKSSVITIDNPVVDEAAGVVIFTVSVKQPYTGPGSFSYFAVDGDAINGLDYIAPKQDKPGVISFANGIPLASDATPFTFQISVPVIDDTFPEGPESFTLILNDAIGGTATIKASDRPGTAAVDDSATTPWNKPVALNLLANDLNPNNDVLTIKLGTISPLLGSVTINQFGRAIYTPNGVVGDDSFTYSVTDGQGHTDVGLVSIQVSDDRPSAVADTATTSQDRSVNINILANDSDPNRDSLTVLEVSAAQHGSVKIGANGVLTYTPDAAYEGVDTFNYTLGDSSNPNQGLSTTGQVTVHIGSGTPVALSDSATTSQNRSVAINVLANDSDPQNDRLAVVLDTGPNHGQASVGPGGIINYTPASGFYGSDQLIYTINDGQNHKASATVNIVVRNTGAGAPLAISDNLVTSTDRPATIAVLANDSDPEGDALTIAKVSNGLHGTTSVDGQGLITYTPSARFTGSDSFTYEIADGQGHFSTGLVRVTVAEGRPTAVDDSALTSQDRSINIKVLANDSDPQGDPLSVKEAFGAQHGTTVVAADGLITYTPAAGYEGVDTFNYILLDSSQGREGLSTTGQVTVRVGSGTPVALSDSATTGQNQSIAINVLANDSDPQNDKLTVSLDTGPNHGQASVGSAGVITYTPAVGYYGSDQLIYTINDGQNHKASATVNIVVRNTGAGAPVAVTDNLVTSQDRPAVVAVLANDTDKEGDRLSVTSVANGLHGTTSLDDRGVVTYTPATLFTGNDSFTYEINDGQGHASSGLVRVTVADGRPVAGTDTAVTSQNHGVNIRVLANDSDPQGDPLTVAKDTFGAQHGSTQVADDGLITYTPDRDYAGSDSFNYKLTDNFGHSVTGIVNVLVKQTNGAPTAVSDQVTVSEDKPLLIPVLANDSDPESDSLSLISLSTPDFGKAVAGQDNKVFYTPKSGFTGADHFSYVVGDGQGHFSTGLVNITVEDGRPVAVTDNLTVTMLQPTTIAVLANDSDPQGDVLSVESVSAPLHGKAFVSSASEITYLPDSTYTGQDTFTYVVTDGLHSSVGLVGLNVSAVIPDTPVAADDSVSTIENVAVSLNVLANDSDPKGSTLSVVGVTVPVHGSATFDKTGTIQYVPSTGFSGNDGFDYTVVNANGQKAQATVNISVIAKNDPPVVESQIPDQFLTERSYYRFVLPVNTFVDPDGDRLNMSAIRVDGSWPSWLMFDPASQSFSGTSDDGAAGNYRILVSAKDTLLHSVSDEFILTVAAPVSPVTTSGPASLVKAMEVSSTPPDLKETLTESEMHRFEVVDFPFTENLTKIQIGDLPGQGRLLLGGQAVMPGQVVSVSDLENGLLTYSSPDQLSSLTDHFDFMVGDGKAYQSAMTFDLNFMQPDSARSGSDGSDRMKGTGKADVIIAFDGDDFVDGRGGADRLLGEAGDDVIKGGKGDDFLSGSTGKDKLFGQAGKDSLEGGAGSDYLDGGSGRDVYVYGAADLVGGDHDMIVASRGDLIQFDSSILANLKSNGVPLSQLAGQSPGSSINANSDIAFVDHSILLDINHDGQFVPAQDLTIEIVGQAQKVSVDVAGLLLG